MLIRDAEFFESKYPSAAAFVREAKLRQEMFALVCHEAADVLAPWQADRLEELRRADLPSLQEPWFVDLISSEVQRRRAAMKRGA